MRPSAASFFPRCSMLPSMAALFVLLLCTGVLGAEALGKGDSLPPLQIVAPDLAQDQRYLGVPSQGVFGMEDIDGDLVILELVGVYCPYCHKQAPLFNSLFKRLQRSGLDARVKMLAVASGATAPEVAQLRKHSSYAFPVLRDEDYSLHAALGEPQTPFTIVVNKNNEILFAKLGVVEDIDAFFETIQQLAS